MMDWQVNDDSSDFCAVNPAVIKVIGCGGGGGNAVNTMIDANVQGVEFIALNTDGQDLNKSKAKMKIQIGKKSSGGLGAGGDPLRGEEAAKESESEIREALSGANMVFITAGMGGGTGTGSAPVVASVAKELGALTVAIVTYPFDFEKSKRAENADLGIKKLQGEVDSLLVIPNQKIFEINKNIPVRKAFQYVTDILRQGVQGISDIIMKPGLINRDFRDVESVMKGQGKALLGIGEGEGDNRAIDAATNAISNPLLEGNHIDGAQNILINVSGGDDVTIDECEEIAKFITDRAARNANVIWGLVADENIKDQKLNVTVIATGFDRKETASIQQAPVQTSAAKKRDDDMFTTDDFVKISTTKPKPHPAVSPVVETSVPLQVEPVQVKQPETRAEKNFSRPEKPVVESAKKKPSTTVDVTNVLGGAQIYEDDGSAPQGQSMYQQDLMAEQSRYSQPQPEPEMQEPKSPHLPDDFVYNPQDITTPTWAREAYQSKLSGLKPGINLGTK